MEGWIASQNYILVTSLGFDVVSGNTSDGDEMLNGTGRIAIQVDFSVQSGQLLASFVPSSAGVDVTIDDTGVGDWKCVRAAVSAERLEPFFTGLVDLLSVSDGDCGTHGFWVTRCAIHLPLSSSNVDVEATHGDTFSSGPVVEHVLAFVDQLAMSPAGYAVSWRAYQRQRKLGVVAIALSALAALGFVLLGLR